MKNKLYSLSLSSSDSLTTMRELCTLMVFKLTQSTYSLMILVLGYEIIYDY
jgi:hypothetical protein